MAATKDEKSVSSSEKQQVKVGDTVTFVHPDGREIPAYVVEVIEEAGTVNLVALEGDTAPFGGTQTYNDVGYAEAGEEPIRHSYH